MATREVDPISFLLFLPFYLLNILTSSLPQFPTFPQFPTPATMSSSTSSSSPKTSYSNVEEWTIKEMPDGTVKMVIHRKVSRS